MSDCAWTKVTCRPEDRAVFEEYGFDDDSEPADLAGALALINEAANYGGDPAFREIAAKGIPFYAVHAAGDEYGGGFYACDGKRVVGVERLEGGDCPAVEVSESGEPDSDQLALVRDYYAVLAAAKRAISEGVSPGSRWKSADDILKGMDPALFAEQRRWLLIILESIREGTLSDADGLNLESAVDPLDGLMNLLDELTDYAHDVLGMDCLLEQPDPQPEGG